MGPSNAAPLILTLTLDEATQAYFNDLRRQHFPPNINYLAAHLTLFHHLPGADLGAMSECPSIRPATVRCRGRRRSVG